LELAEIRASEEIVAHSVFAEFEEFPLEIEGKGEQKHDFKCHIIFENKLTKTYNI